LAITQPLTMTVRRSARAEHGVHVVLDQQHVVLFEGLQQLDHATLSLGHTSVNQRFVEQQHGGSGGQRHVAISSWRCSP
jgi:hypothetical protein